jgi:hypothetical protein
MIQGDRSELLAKLVEICRRGPIDQVASGANAVGKTLQVALGVQHRTTSRNAVSGYTVTATQGTRNSSSRTNLFASVAAWRDSPVKSSGELLDICGRPDEDKGYERSLFCTSSALGPNGFGLYLAVNGSYLEERLIADSEDRLLLRWPIASLLNLLAEKQGMVAIVTALRVPLNGRTAFHYRYVEIFEDLNTAIFERLLVSGSISVDHLISRKVNSAAAREQGPLFKIRGDARPLLYGRRESFDLAGYNVEKSD